MFRIQIRQLHEYVKNGSVRRRCLTFETKRRSSLLPGAEMYD